MGNARSRFVPHGEKEARDKESRECVLVMPEVYVPVRNNHIRAPGKSN